MLCFAQAALRTGHREQAVECFARAVKLHPQDDVTSQRIAATYLEHVQALIGTTRTDELAASLAQARDLYRRLLHEKNFDQDCADRFANLLLIEDQLNDDWEILKPIEITSAGGAILTELEDRSILASGPLPDQEVYTLTSSPIQRQISFVILETFPDPSLPSQNAGRYPNSGYFSLHQFKIEAINDVANNEGEPVAISSVVTNCLRPRSEGMTSIESIIEPVDGKSWVSTLADHSQPRRMVFELEQPLQLQEGGALRILIDCTHSLAKKLALGRFRLSVGGNAKDFEQEQLKLAIEKSTNGWEKLGAVLELIGEKQLLGRLLDDAPESVAGMLMIRTLRGDWAIAIRDLQTAIQRHLGNQALAIELSKFCLEAKEKNAAFAGLTAVIDAQQEISMSAQSLAFALRARSSLYAREGQWQSAAEDSNEALNLAPSNDSRDWMAAAALYAYAGDVEGHRKLCTKMKAFFGKAEDSTDPERITKVMLLMETGFEHELNVQEYPVRPLLVSLESDPRYYRHYFLLTRALFECRTGRYEDAQNTIKDWEREFDQIQGVVMFLKQAVQALIWAKQGVKFEETQNLLEEAKREMETTQQVQWESDGLLDGNTVITSGFLNYDILIPDILCREVERLIANRDNSDPISKPSQNEQAQP